MDEFSALEDMKSARAAGSSPSKEAGAAGEGGGENELRYDSEGNLIIAKAEEPGKFVHKMRSLRSRTRLDLHPEFEFAKTE